jgi:hypothetical protein
VQHATLAETIKSVIQGSLHAQDLASLVLGVPTIQDSRLEEEENWGPKTTVLPDGIMGGDVAKLVDLGPNIPSKV